MSGDDLPTVSLREFAPPTRTLLAAVLRTTLAVAILLAVYFVVPLQAESVHFGAFLVVGIGLAAFVALFVRELTQVSQADHPVLKGMESLAAVATLFVVVFSSGYVVMSQSFAASFDTVLSKMDALYFTVTVLSTVGFGDIHAVTGPAKALVTFQMVLDLILIGVGVRLLTTTAKAATQRRHQAQAGPVADVVPGTGTGAGPGSESDAGPGTSPPPSSDSPSRDGTA